MNKNENKAIFTGIDRIDEILTGGFKKGEFFAIVGVPNRRPVMKFPEGKYVISLEMGENTEEKRTKKFTNGNLGNNM